MMDEHGCGNHGCIFETDHTGQKTNIGCSCLEGMRSGTERARLRMRIITMRNALAARDEEVRGLREVLEEMRRNLCPQGCVCCTTFKADLDAALGKGGA